MSEGPYRGASPIDPDEPPADPSRPWLLQTWTSRRECPQCKVPLFAARREGYRIDACGTCGGAWLDHATSARAIKERDLTPAQLSDDAAKRSGRADEAAERHCPVCAVVLRRDLIGIAHVIIDVCDAHGAWFDPDEMRLVIEAVVRQNPIVLDPSVDAAIARERELGRLRPPANYHVPSGFGGGMFHTMNHLLSS
jgi:Zn-finger nucleic acid-binding protein